MAEAPGSLASLEELNYWCGNTSEELPKCISVYRQITPVFVSVILGVWQSILVFVGLVGNSVVIFASTRYSTFNLDSVTVFFVQQLAIADLIYTILMTAPCAITHIMRAWIFGWSACLVYGYGVSFLSPVSFLLTMSISLHRIARCYYPMRMMSFKRQHAVVCVVLVWLVSLCGFTVFLLFYFIPPYVHPQFLPSYPLCYFNMEAPAYPTTLKIHLMIFMGIPFGLILITNFLLLRYSKRKTRDLRKAMKEREVENKRGFNTIYLISILLLTTWTPLVLVSSVRSFFAGTIRTHHFMRIAANSFLLASCGNPIIYACANPKFKAFANQLMARCWVKARNSMLDSVGVNSSLHKETRGETRGPGNETSRTNMGGPRSTSIDIQASIRLPKSRTLAPAWKRSDRLPPLQDSSHASAPVVQENQPAPVDLARARAGSTSDYVSYQEEQGIERRDDDVIQEVEI